MGYENGNGNNFAARFMHHTVAKVKGGGGPLTLPWTKNFEGDTLATLPAEWTQQPINSIWTGTQNTAEVQARVDGFGADIPHTKAMFLGADHTANYGSTVSMDLGSTIDMSAGIRVQWYARHYNEDAGGEDAAIMYCPSFHSESDGTGDFVRCHQQATSENYAKLQWYAGVGYALDDLNNGDWALQGTHSWRCYHYEIDFTGGYGVLRSYINNTPWANDYGVEFGFTPLAGPQNMRYLCLGSPGSDSTWKVFDSIQVAQVWIGNLIDAWPTQGEVWTV